jgi:hypothetical protein
MKEIVMYQADDGKKFSDKSECLAYESKVALAEEATLAFRGGANLLMAVVMLHPDSKNGFDSFPLSLIKRINKDTLFIFRAPQYRDDPHYRIRRIYHDGQLSMFGRADDISTEHYFKVSPSELLASARITLGGSQ